MPSLRRKGVVPIAILLLSISILPAATAQQLRWPYNLSPDVNYSPEDEPLVRRSEVAQQRLQDEKVVGVKKMSLDEGEMFFPEYWTFESDMEQMIRSGAGDNLRRRNSDSTIGIEGQCANSSIETSLWPAFPLHSDEPVSESPLIGRFFTRQLAKRFQCPSDTSACTSINRPDSCCATGETCQIIQDTGLGDVGCCPAGQTCAGQLSTCQSGYTSCPNNPGGGCCIPGYACLDVGCAISSTATVLASLFASSQTQSPASSLPPVTLTSTTTVIVPPSPAAPSSSSTSSTSTSTTTSTSSSSPLSTITTTPIVTASPITSSVIVVTTITSTSSSLVVSPLTCSSSYRSCPASLGGGCCPTDRACGSPSCPALSSTQSLVPPVRGTTVQPTTTSVLSSSSTSSSSTSDVGCPTGFYACSAYYQGGCCRVGRDCSKTSCPASASTTLIDTNSVTAAAPTGSGISATIEGETGTCPTGWALCPTSAGGGCCPSGYACGTSCTVEAAATQTGFGQLVNKVQPSGANMVFVRHSVLRLLVVMISVNIFFFMM